MSEENTTQCLVHYSPGTVKLESCQIDTPGVNDCLVETKYSAISPGTELRCLTAGNDAPSFVPGYLGVGEIMESGKLSGFQQGDKVVFGGAKGFHKFQSRWGCHSKCVVVERSKLCLIPDGVSDLDAVISKLAAVALHGVRLAGVANMDRVLILGLGILGQLAARIASQSSPHILALGRNSARVNIATSAGIRAHDVVGRIDDTLNQLFGGNLRADVIIDTTGNPDVLGESIALANELLPWETPVKTATRYVLQGSFTDHVRIDYEQAFQKELNLLFPRDHTRQDLEEVLDIIASKNLAVSDLVPTPVSPVDAPSAYERLLRPNPEILTAVFDWSLLKG